MKKFFRWLLSNLLLILIIVSVIYCYMFWGNLTGKDTPAGKTVTYLSSEFEGVGHFIEGVKTKQAKLAGLQSTDMQSADSTLIDQSVEQVQQESSLQIEQLTEQIDSEVDAKVDEKIDAGIDTEKETVISNVETIDATSQQDNSEESISKNTSSTAESLEKTGNDADVKKQAVILQNESQLVSSAVESQPVSISYSHNDMHVQQNSDGEVKTLPQSTQHEGEIKSQITEEQSESVAGDLVQNKTEVSDTQVTAADNALDQVGSTDIANISQQDVGQNMSLQDTWIAARKSFYQKKYALSEQSYQSIIAGTRDNFDAYGELGNVYYSQNKFTQAADAYFQAATILLAKGDIQRALNLLQILQQLDKSKASQLQQLIDSSLS